MKKTISFVLLIITLTVLCIIAAVSLFSGKLTKNEMEHQLEGKDDKFQKVLYIRLEKPYTYIFYKTDSQIGLAILHKGGMSIYGYAPISSNNGFTYATGETDDLYIAFGAVQNKQISQVLVNGSMCNIAKTDEGYIWYYVQTTRFVSLSIEALDRSGSVIENQVLYKKANP
ncbi:hypothetical protein [Paenibacillus humicola]|uniref:hypothetical protein n=1 Tax=Paenibacillus humicola TaxID=3110540 RepID=UPI00237B20CE|nr:hypothetical protein [Paenibacillus humicola]